MSISADQLATNAGLKRSDYSAGEWTRITNAIYAAYSKGYEMGYGYAYSTL